jgi:O-antigen/teichoic acid export membrane protein
MALRNRDALWLLVATAVANVLAYAYQVIMARLLRPPEYAILTALFGILLLESISTQVIQSATAKLAAEYRARGEEAALHVFVRRWLRRIVLGAGPPALLIVLVAGLIAQVLNLSAFSVALLGATLFLTAALTFTGGLLQGLRRFGWFGGMFALQAFTRLLVGVSLVILGLGVDGAFVGAAVAVMIGLLITLVPLWPLFSAARGAVHEIELGQAETRFYLLAGVVLLSYAGLTNVDAVAARALLPATEAGAYAGAITMAKVVLFAPIAVGFILLERTARAHALGADTERPLYLALAFVVLTSGAVALGYLVAPAFFTSLIVGAQYPQTASIAGPYGLAALGNALLSLWIAYFIGRGEMRVGFLLALGVVAELALLVLLARDAATMVRVVLGIAAAMQLAAVATFLWERRWAAGAQLRS